MGSSLTPSSGTSSAATTTTTATTTTASTAIPAPPEIASAKIPSCFAELAGLSAEDAELVRDGKAPTVESSTGEGAKVMRKLLTCSVEDAYPTFVKTHNEVFNGCWDLYNRINDVHRDHKDSPEFRRVIQGKVAELRQKLAPLRQSTEVMLASYNPDVVGAGEREIDPDDLEKLEHLLLCCELLEQRLDKLNQCQKYELLNSSSSETKSLRDEIKDLKSQINAYDKDIRENTTKYETARRSFLRDYTARRSFLRDYVATEQPIVDARQKVEKAEKDVATYEERGAKLDADLEKFKELLAKSTGYSTKSEQKAIREHANAAEEDQEAAGQKVVIYAELKAALAKANELLDKTPEQAEWDQLCDRLTPLATGLGKKLSAGIRSFPKKHWEKGQKLSQEREGANVDKALQEAKSALAVAENTEIAKLVAATDALASQSTPRVVVQGGLRGALKQEAIPLLEDLLNATKWETLDARNALLRACAEGDTDGFDAVFDRLANAINEDQDIRKQFAELALDPGVVGLRTLLEDLFPTAEMNLSAFEEEFKRLLAAPPSGPAIPEELRGSVDALRSFNLERTEELKTLKKSKDDAQTKKAAEKEKIDELRQREKRSTDRLHATEKQLDRRAHRTALVEHLGRGANFKAKEEDIRARILTPTAFKNAESVRDGARTVNAYAGAGIPMELVCWPHINGDPKHSQLVARIDEALLHVEALKQLGRSEEAKAAASRLAKNIEQIQEEAKRYVQTLIAGHGGDLMRQRSGLDAWGAPTPPRESVAYHLRELKSYLESPSPKSAPLYPTEQGWTESLRSSKNTDSHPYTRQRINDVHRIQQALKAGREDFATLKAKELHLRLGQHGDLTGILERIQKWAESPMVDLPEGIQELPYPVGRSTLLVVSNPVNQETEDTDTDSDLDM